LIHDVTFTRRYPSLSNNFIPVLLIVITAPVRILRHDAYALFKEP